jgi:hypothetical protein
MVFPNHPALKRRAIFRMPRSHGSLAASPSLFENSPAIHGWVEWPQLFESPKGRQNLSLLDPTSESPSVTLEEMIHFLPMMAQPNQALKRRAFSG